MQSSSYIFKTNLKTFQEFLSLPQYLLIMNYARSYILAKEDICKTFQVFFNLLQYFLIVNSYACSKITPNNLS